MATSETLQQSVQRLLRLLMNKDVMTNLLVRFNLDVDKMPLGKIEKKSIIAAFNILAEIQSMIKESARNARFVEATNRFVTLIPHRVDHSDTINSHDQVNNKIQLLKILSQTKFTYELIYKDTGKTANILDVFYSKLNTKIEPLQSLDERQMIGAYVQDTRMDYQLDIVEIFRINRNDDENHNHVFGSYSNRMLLWHGSRITNIAHILQQGLQIGRENMMAIGCMFGKGHYFSDVFANSAQYCYAAQTDNNGLILLCEVALGNSHLCYGPENIEDLPLGKDSVHGVGRKSSISNVPFNGTILPSGSPVEHMDIETSLDYNEFVVYKKDQIKIKYLVWFKCHNPDRPNNYNL